MRNSNDKYQSYKKALGKLLRENGLSMMSNDKEVVNRLLNLLTENCQTEKIEGIISTTEIVKNGGNIEEDEAKQIFLNIKYLWE